MNRTLFLYLQAAKALNLPMEYRDEFDGVSLILAGKTYYFRHGYTPFNAGATDNIALNKYSINHLLNKAGFPVPLATAVSIKDRVNGVWTLPKLNYPIVAKPTAGTSCGLDVFCNIKNEQTLIEYLNKVAEKHQFISLETFEQNLISYRVLVFFNKVIAVTRRDPACVIGDGKHSISELIDIENEKRDKITTVTLDQIKVDREYETKLKEMNITLDYIPRNYQKIILCYTCNSTRGGTMTSLGKSICRANAKLACKAAKLLELNLVGFDIICEDIMITIKKSRGFIIEANSNPDLTIHESPLAGPCVQVTKIFLQNLIKKHPIAYVCNYLKTMLATNSDYEKSIS